MLIRPPKVICLCRCSKWFLMFFFKITIPFKMIKIFFSPVKMDWLYQKDLILSKVQLIEIIMGFATQLITKYITKIYYVHLVLTYEIVVLFLNVIKNSLIVLSMQYCHFYCSLPPTPQIQYAIFPHIKIWILCSLSVIANFSKWSSSVRRRGNIFYWLLCPGSVSVSGVEPEIWDNRIQERTA